MMVPSVVMASSSVVIPSSVDGVMTSSSTDAGHRVGHSARVCVHLRVHPPRQLMLRE
jgi:hypothetical protein